MSTAWFDYDFAGTGSKQDLFFFDNIKDAINDAEKDYAKENDLSKAQQLNIVYVKDELNNKDWFNVELKENKGDYYFGTLYCDYSDANTIDESDVIMNLDELAATLIYDAESDEIVSMI